MAIKINFDTAGNPEQPTLVLSKKSGDKLGVITNIEGLSFIGDMENPDGFSFVATKGVCQIWDQLKDFRLIYVPEWENKRILNYTNNNEEVPNSECYFELTVTINENDIVTKTVEAKHLAEAELSQLNIYDMEINTDDDIEYLVDRENAEKGGTVFYNPNNERYSLLHRLLSDKGQNFKILHVDETLWGLVRDYSFNDKSIHDCFNEIAEEIECHFEYSTCTKDDGSIGRYISVYDLNDYCKECENREPHMTICSECGNHDDSKIIRGYGKDTTVFLSVDNLVEDVTFETDVDSVKNCFRLEAADDQMTSAIMACNPNGSQYIYYLADWLKDDMSDKLRDKIDQYNDIYQKYYNDYNYTNNTEDIKVDYKVIVMLNSYIGDYNNMMISDHGYDPYEEDPESDKYYDRDKNPEYIEFLEFIPKKLIGYSKLMESFYDVIDLELYLKSEMMPSIKGVDTNVVSAMEEWNLLRDKLKDTYNDIISIDSLKYATNKTCENAIVEFLRCFIDTSRFEWDVVRKENTDVVVKDNTAIWTGNIILRTLEENEDGTPVSEYGEDEKDEITITFNDTDLASYTELRIRSLVVYDNKDDYSLKSMFGFTSLNGEEQGLTDEQFIERLKRYSLDSLDNLLSICQGAIDIIYMKYSHISDIDNIKDEDIDNVISDMDKVGIELLNKYRDKRTYINQAIKELEDKIKIIAERDDKTDILTGGLLKVIDDARKATQDKLRLQEYINNEKLWSEFISFRREQTYSNSNYAAEDMDFDNSELFRWASEFIKSANKELSKSAEEQHSINATIKGMWSIPEFKPIFDQFESGNWLRIQVDTEVYKLRLMTYQIDYDDPTHTSVTFSDVLRYGTDLSDIESILHSASSMATSYGYVEHQVNKKLNKTNQFVENLEEIATVVSVASNNERELEIGENGLIARDFDRIIGDYSPEQLKITHNMIQFTDDGWDTVRTALGKQYFSKIDENGKLVNNVLGYGLRSDYIFGGTVQGSTMISGDIYSDAVNDDEKPLTHIDLNSGAFSFADGKFTGTPSKDGETFDVSIRGEIFAESGVIGDIPIKNGHLMIDTVTADQVITNIITSKDGDGNSYIDLLQGVMSIDKITSKNDKAFIDLVNGVVSIDSIKTDVITGLTSDEYFIDLVSGEVRIDKISSSDGRNAITFINDVVEIDKISTNVITGLSDNQNFIDLVNGIVSIPTIYADKIVSRDTDENGNPVKVDSKVFIDLANGFIKTETLNSEQAEFAKAFMGTFIGKSGYILDLSADQLKVDNATIYEAVAANVSVADLKAGRIKLSDHLYIESENGGMIMKNNTFQIFGRDEDGNLNELPGIQLGYDASGKPSLILCDDNGNLLIDTTGVHADAIADGLIVNNMVGTGAISKDKLSFNIDTEKDENGNEYLVTNINNIMTGDGGKFGVEYTSFKELTNTSLNDLDKKIEDNLEYEVIITSSNGNIFKNGEISTILSCHVYKSNIEITDQINSSKFHWKKINNDGSFDEIWNIQHSGGTKEITISPEDVYGRGTFTCEVDGIPLA